MRLSLLKPTRVWIKLSIAFVLMIIMIMGLVTYTFTLRQISAERKELRDSMAAIARMVASVRFVESEGWYIYQDWIDNLVQSDATREIIYIAVFDENRTLVARTLNSRHLDLGVNTYLTPSEEYEIIERLVQGQIAEESRRDFDHIRVNISEGDNYLGRVDVGFSLVDFNIRVYNRLLINLGFFILFTFSAILGSIFLGKRMTRPITRMTEAMKSVSEGRLDQNLQIPGRDEIAELARTFNYMTARLKERQVIEQFARKLAFTSDYETLHKTILSEIAGAASAKKAALFTRRKTESGQDCFFASAYPRIREGLHRIDLDRECCRELGARSAPVIREQFEHINGLGHLLSVAADVLKVTDVHVVVSLNSNGELLGIAMLSGPPGDRQYDEDELQFLQILADQATFAVEHVQVLEDLKAREHFERELEIARSVQQRLLPQGAPPIDGAQLTGTCLPAYEVGGDYFDYFRLDENRIGIAIADVSGKGTSAAFYMAEMKGMMSSLAPVVDSPKRLLEIVNHRLYKKIDRRVFATMIYGIWDCRTNEFLFVRAGHNALLLKRANGETELLVPQGIGLGLADSEFFHRYSDEIKLGLESGDTILLYTDGISEARNDLREEYGEDRLVQLLDRLNGVTLDEMQQRILQDVSQFSQNQAQHDDITMVLLKVD